jgi:hypothetical protein
MMAPDYAQIFHPVNRAGRHYKRISAILGHSPKHDALFMRLSGAQEAKTFFI